jgi:hypothetical protein
MPPVQAKVGDHPLTGVAGLPNVTVAFPGEHSGVFHLTVFVPAVYAPGDLIGWAVAGARPTGKPGVGAWAKDAAADIDSLFEVQEFRPYSANGLEGILTVRSLRGQF